MKVVVYFDEKRSYNIEATSVDGLGVDVSNASEIILHKSATIIKFDAIAHIIYRGNTFKVPCARGETTIYVVGKYLIVLFGNILYIISKKIHINGVDCDFRYDKKERKFYARTWFGNLVVSASKGPVWGPSHF